MTEKTGIEWQGNIEQIEVIKERIILNGNVVRMREGNIWIQTNNM